MNRNEKNDKLSHYKSNIKHSGTYKQKTTNFQRQITSKEKIENHL